MAAQPSRFRGAGFRPRPELSPDNVLQRKPRPLQWRDLAVCLSFANLCYLRIWSELLTWSRPDAYTMKQPFSRADYLAAMLNVLIVGALGFALVAAVRHAGPRLRTAARWAFFLALLLPLNALRSVLSNRFDYLRSGLFELLGVTNVLLLVIVLCAAAALATWRWSRPLARAFGVLLFILSPLVAMTFGQSLWRIARYDPSGFLEQPHAPLLAGAKTAPRIVWVIFDEWDQRLTFVDRPRDLALPEIDRFRSESLYAGNAYSPGPETPISMPALITGHMVEEVIRRGPADLDLVYPGRKQPVRFDQQPNIFADARAAGFNTAIVGWYHPYCRELGSSVSACEWWPLSMQYNSMGSNLFDLIPGQTRSLFETSLTSLFGQSLSTEAHGRTYLEMMAKTTEVIADPAYGLMLIHLPTPHAPHPYNRRTGRFDLRNAPISGYADSLALADRTVGELRRTLERSGLWNSTTVLLTTDHSYRAAVAFDGKSDHRIPFLLKLAGHAEPLEFRQPFNTLLTRDFLLAILHREIATPQDAARWLDAHRTIADSPYNHN